MTKGIPKSGINKGWFKKGKSFWLGKSHSSDTKRKISLSKKLRYISDNELKQRISNTLKNKYKKGILINKRKGIKYNMNDEHKNKIKNSLLKFYNINIHKNTGRKYTKEHIRNSLKRKLKSSLEVKFENIINKYNLPYKFVGNGKFFIGRKNPDFINEENKIAIEVFYRKHKCIISSKDKFNIGYDFTKLDKYKNEREDYFNQYGWKTIFFDETQVNENNVITLLGAKHS